MERKDTKSELIRIGAEIFGVTGFNATGLEAVLKKAHVPKGSFYYYFPSKEDFGLAVIDKAAKELAVKLDFYLNDATHSPLLRVRRYLESMAGSVEAGSCRRGCLIGNLGQELAGQNEKFRQRLEAAFRFWSDRLAEVLAEAQTAGEVPKTTEAKLLASLLLTGWEGAILRAKVMQSGKPMREFIEVFFEKVLR